MKNFLNLKSIRAEFLSNYQYFVKVLITLIAINAHSVENIGEQVTLSKGQVIEINARGVSQFAVGNKDIIRVKFNKQTNRFLLTGLMQGYSELKTIGSNQRIIKVYVLSKNQQLDLLELKNSLDAIGLSKISIFGQKLILEGEIATKDQYLNIFEAISKSSKHIINNLKLSKNLRKEIIGEVYYDFFQNYLDEIYCEESKALINCATTLKILSNKEFIKNMSNKHGVSFYPSLTFGKLENYQIEMKIFQIEKLDGSEINFGLDQVNANLGELFTSGIDSILKTSTMKLKNTEYDLSTLATPKAILKLDKKLEIKIGSEIPFSSASSAIGTSQTKWKFAGLSIDLTMTKENNQFRINYQTNLSRPISGEGNEISSISGNSQASSFSINLNKPIQIFEIDIKTDDQERNSIPLLGSIPLLKNIFQSKSNMSTYKKIVAIVRVVNKEI